MSPILVHHYSNSDATWEVDQMHAEESCDSMCDPIGGLDGDHLF